MNKFIISAAVLVAALGSANAQTQAKSKLPEYEFKVLYQNPITSIKNQNRSGTCWCFSGISFLESEAIRKNKLSEDQYPDFSEMFVVSHSYQDRAVKYVRMDGAMGFAAGSEGDDVLHVMQKYGLVPQEVMQGLNYGTNLPVHAELDAVAKAYVDAIVKNPNKTLSTAWKRGFKGIMDAYLGECPEEFEYNGKKYTPASYRDSFGLDADDFITIASTTEAPYYSQFVIEVCDNWRADRAYNLPLEEFWAVIESSLKNGYTGLWGGDVSEAGFTRDGLGVLLAPKSATSGSDQERWTGKAGEEKKEEAVFPKELDVTDASRQEMYDNKSTTDDHGMHAFGLAEDQNGTKYVMIKNSWGESGKYKGIWYLSENFTKGKCIDYIVAKEALPKDIRKKLGL